MRNNQSYMRLSVLNSPYVDMQNPAKVKQKRDNASFSKGFLSFPTFLLRIWKMKPFYFIHLQKDSYNLSAYLMLKCSPQLQTLFSIRLF